MIRNGIVRKEVDEIGNDMSSAAQPELGANSSLSEVKQPSYLPTAKSTSENDLTTDVIELLKELIARSSLQSHLKSDGSLG